MPDQIMTPLAEQSLTIPTTTEFGRVIGGVAFQLRDVRAERAGLAKELEARLEDHPLASILSSMPGIGLGTAAKILTIIGDVSSFSTAGPLAAYAGLVPVTPSLGCLDTRGIALSARQPSVQERFVLVCFRQPRRSGQPGLLRLETRRG